MHLWSAFLLGIFGSLHCALMCGPLMLALKANGGGGSGILPGRVIYHSGRICMYGAIGALLGLAGHTLALAGFQDWLSIGAGVAILASLCLPGNWSLTSVPVKPIVWLKGAFANLLKKRTFASVFLLGALNGLLPCGLVYVASAAAIATGHVLRGTEFMIAFGVGTIPMMLGISVAGHKLRPILQARHQKLIPICVGVIGVCLVLRGLSLGIPFLSPADAAPCH